MKTSQKLASFTKAEAPPANAEMWPLHALLWLQPDLNPVRPRSSGLRIERRYKAPAPEFLPVETASVSDPPLRQHSCEPQPALLGRRVPRSDLVPLGWDPRTVCAKGGAE